MNAPIKIKKYSGALVAFDMDKLVNSLRNTKANEELVQKIAKKVEHNLFEGISTKQIYKMAFRMLRRNTNNSASRYKLKKAIMELGPSGFPFEKFVGKILSYEGFDTKIGVVMQGKCVSHEVDVIAIKKNKHFIIECKYHNSKGRINDIKIPLYIQSRFLDIKAQLIKEKINEPTVYKGCIYTNTRFSRDAISFAKCSDLQLVSWDYPINNSLKVKINKYHLFPITTLTTLTKSEKLRLLEGGYVLCKDICESPTILAKVGINKKRHKKIIKNAINLCNA